MVIHLPLCRYTHSLLCLFLLLLVSQVVGQVDPSTVEIFRDKWGVPHVYASTDAGATYGLAWAHAEDDFETIQLPLLSAKQMLGKYLGPKGAAVDYVVELLRLQETAIKYQQKVSPAFRKVVLAYVQSMNRFAELNPDRVLLKKAFPITEIDAYKAYGLSLAVISGADKTISDLFAGKVDPIMKGVGSNAFAFAPSKTVEEETFLTVNSHQPLEGPVAWYEAHIASDEGLNMIGGLFPGAPVVLHGTNEHLGWAHTVNYPDKVDVFQLEMEPNSKTQYKMDGKWKELERKKVKLKFKLAGIPLSIKKEVLWSDFGPAVRNKKGVFAFHLSTLHEIGALEQWYEMNKAQDFEEFKEVLSDVRNPGFNIVYGDKQGNIAHFGYGKIPRREAGPDWRGVIPGNESQYIIKDYHTFDDLPRNENPSAGFVFNTNNSAFSSSAEGNNPPLADFDETMGYDLWENNRSIRFLSLVDGYKNVHYEDFKKIKYDNTLSDSLVFQIDLNPLFDDSFAPLAPKAQLVKDIIGSWDRQADLDAFGPVHLILTYSFLNELRPTAYKSYYLPSPDQFEEALLQTYKYLKKHFGKLDVALEEFQFLVRGNRQEPIWGMPDVLTAIHTAPWKKGKRRAVQGESYIMMIRYPKSGSPVIETVNVYGASNQEGSNHYDDQMDLFLNQELKPMTLDWEVIKNSAARSYSPK